MATKKVKRKPEEEEAVVPAAEEAAEEAAPESEEAPEEAAPAEEESSSKKGKAKKGEIPEMVAGTGKFQAVEVDGGFVVFNPSGQRASGVVTDSEARDLVVKHNTAAGLK